MQDRIRLFTALKASADLHRQVQELPRKGLDSAHWSHPDDLHITLRFLGDVERDRLAEIEEILEGIRVRKFGVVVKGLDIFQRKKGGVLYAAVESTRKLTHLNSEVTERLQKLGFVFPEKFYTPHVTLARVNNVQGLKEYSQKNSRLIRAEWSVESFYLFQSADPDEKQRRYTALRKYKLSEF
jgi:RNA 2',3'-cyclic 3'-phosphodiesterase